MGQACCRPAVGGSGEREVVVASKTNGPLPLPQAASADGGKLGFEQRSPSIASDSENGFEDAEEGDLEHWQAPDQAGQQGQQQVPAPERSQDEERRQRSLSLQPSTTAAAAAPSEPPPPPAHRVNAFFAALEAPHVESGETLLARARFLRGQARALEAHALLTAACLESGLSLGDLAAHSEALGLDVLALERDVAAIHAALAALADDTGYLVSREGGGEEGALRVLYRHRGGSTLHSIKFRAAFPHPPEHLLALAHEFDLITTWNKFCLESIKVAQVGLFESVVYGSQWMPPPFRDMQSLVRARGFDLGEEHKCLMILVEDATEESLPARHAPLPAKRAKRRDCNVQRGTCIKIRALPPGPNGEPRTEGDLMVHVDPHIPMVPEFLINFILAVMAPHVHAQMSKVLDDAFADAGAVFPTRIREQPALYAHLASRMAEIGITARVGGGAGGDIGGGDDTAYEEAEVEAEDAGAAADVSEVGGGSSKAAAPLAISIGSDEDDDDVFLDALEDLFPITPR